VSDPDTGSTPAAESATEHRTLRQSMRDLPASAWLLVGGSAINRFGTFVVPFLVLYLRHRGYSVAQAGAAVAGYGLGEVGAGWLGGQLADRIGRKHTIAISMFGSAAVMLGLSQVHGYAGIVVLVFMAGLVTEARRPASLALMTDLTAGRQRVTAFAVRRTAENVAFAGGVALGGVLANSSFLWLFIGDALSSAIYGVVALAALPDTRDATKDEAPVARSSYREILADRSFLTFLVASTLLFFVYFQQLSTLPLHVLRSGLSNADFGLLLSLNGILVMLLEIPVSSLTMRRPGKQMVALGFLLVGLGFGLTSVAHTMLVLGITVVIWTLGEMVAAPVGYAYVAELAPAHMRGRYQGLYGITFSLGAVLGPGLGAVLFGLGETAFWALCGVIALAAALMVLGRQRRRPAAELPMAETDPFLP
jgi:MFS family permease